MSGIKLVLFDVAGTTIKDDGIVVKAFTRGLASSGIEVSESELAQMVEYVNATMGQRKIDVFRHLMGQDFNKANNLHNHFINAHDKLVREGKIIPIQGIEKTFKDLKAQGIRVGLTTGFPREILGQIITGLNWGKYLDVSVAASEVELGRPAPDMIIKACSRVQREFGIQISPENVAVVGDTVSDMGSGVAAKAKLIVGVTSGASSESELFAAGATHVLPDATGILSLIY